MSKLKFFSSLTAALLAASFAVQADDPISCEELVMFGTGVVITTDFEGIATDPGNAGAVELLGDEFYGFALTADAGGLWVGIPDLGLGTDNCVNFFANDFEPVSGDAVFSPGNCEYLGSPIGTVIVDFDAPVSALGLSFLDAEGFASSVTAYDSAGGTGNVVDSSVAQTTGDNAQAFRYVSSLTPSIASAVIQLGGDGDGVGMDDLCFVDPDSDGDGVSNSADVCPDTVATDPNVPTVRLGTNRWIWQDWDWVTDARGVERDFTIEQTLGCSCEQILDVLVDKTDRNLEGHYKFGCSKSILEDWIAGQYFMETVEVQAASEVPVESLTVLKSSENYHLMAYGVADAQMPPQASIFFDAKYSVTTPGEDPINPVDWTDSVTGYEAYGPQLLDLHVNGAFIDWGIFNPAHTYWHEMAGTDAPVSLWIYDVYYPNNEGFLSVDIFVDLW